MLARRTQPKGRLKAFQVEPQVFINNGWSETFTAIEVNGLDRPGLLYDLTMALAKLNLNIASAHIATYGERAVDVFYVTDLTGHKIVSEARQSTITRRLVEALDPDRRPDRDKQAKARSRRRVAAAS
jgi:[protein-PII] uridylyltransferase